MEVCANDHDEIVYEGGRNTPCPLCECMGAVGELEKEVTELQKEMEDHVCSD